MNTSILDPIPTGFGETYRRVMPYGRHARVFWKPQQRTVADLIAEHGDPIGEHFRTVPRDTDSPPVLAGEG